MFWHCPHNKTYDNNAIKCSDHLEDLAYAEWRQYPCFWLRRVMPLALGQPTHDEALVTEQFLPHYVLTAPAVGAWPSGALRRVGIGVAHLSSTNNALLFGVGSPLFGDHQTVHRGEAAAALFLILHLDNDASVDYYGDNVNFVDSYNKGKHLMLRFISRFLRF